MFRILHRFFQRIGSDRRDEISCAKIERPSPLEKPSCKVQLFAQNRSRNYRQKVTVTTLFPTVPHRVFNFSHKRPTFAFTGESGYTLGFRRKIAHSGSHAETGAFPPPATASSPKEQPEEADARLWRVSASSGVAAPLGCVIFFCFCQNCGLHTMCSVLSACARRGVVSPLLVCSACCRNSRPPLVKTTNLPFSEIG